MTGRRRARNVVFVVWVVVSLGLGGVLAVSGVIEAVRGNGSVAVRSFLAAGVCLWIVRIGLRPRRRR